MDSHPRLGRPTSMRGLLTCAARARPPARARADERVPLVSETEAGEERPTVKLADG
jgi:hypothetical protein